MALPSLIFIAICLTNTIYLSELTLPFRLKIRALFKHTSIPAGGMVLYVKSPADLTYRYTFTRRDSSERYDITTPRRRSFHRVCAAVKNPISRVDRATTG